MAHLVPSIKVVLKETDLLDFINSTCDQLIDMPTINQQDFQDNDFDSMIYCLTLEIIWILTNIASNDDFSCADVLQTKELNTLVNFISKFIQSDDLKIKSSLVMLIGNLMCEEEAAILLVEKCTII